ncbi:MAG: glycosyltransferase [Gemmatimonadetes bacterium]|nr:glycosyltransferase [Gemmatimonadota bacterium]
MRLSILLPCRDAAAVLPAAIASLERQTFAAYEVVAVDDGSRDATPALLAAWASRDARVRVLRTPPRGIAHALALALAEARGELVARMDADDVAAPDRLERQVAFLDSEPEVAACGCGVRYFPRPVVRDGARRYEAWLNSLSTPASLARDIFVECPIAHPTLVARRAALEAVGGYRDPGWPEDYDLVLRLWAAGRALASVPRVLLHWRESPGRASRVDPRYSPDAFRRCKVHYLKATLLRRRAGVVVWGAGPVGKAFALELRRQDVPVRAFVDLDPRKIGQEIHGAPVIPPERIDAFRGAFAVAAVGSPGAREEIRGVLDAAGWKELEDYCAVA